jgi:phosphoadenosine phosphosulfate reductase
METRPSPSGIPNDVVAATALAAIDWAWSTHPGRVCVLSSMQDAVVIDLAMRIDQRIPIVFLDTGYHFAETLDTVDRVERRYDIEVERIASPAAVIDNITPGECCAHKATMLDQALSGRGAWITGLQRTETTQRANAELIGEDRRGAMKVCPVAQWSNDDRLSYIERHNIITNPLLADGYESIGCRTCTTRPTNGPRSGRWAGTDKTECGLHV